MAAIAVALFLLAVPAGATGASPELARAQTLAVTSVAFFQIFYLLVCRTLTAPVRSIGYASNPYVFAGIGLLLVLQVGFVHLPVMQALFRTADLTVTDWLLAAAAGAVVIPVVAAEKAWRHPRLNRPPGLTPQHCTSAGRRLERRRVDHRALAPVPGGPGASHRLAVGGRRPAGTAVRLSVDRMGDAAQAPITPFDAALLGLAAGLGIAGSGASVLTVVWLGLRRMLDAALARPGPGNGPVSSRSGAAGSTGCSHRTIGPPHRQSSMSATARRGTRGVGHPWPMRRTTCGGRSVPSSWCIAARTAGTSTSCDR